MNPEPNDTEKGVRVAALLFLLWAVSVLALVGILALCGVPVSLV